MTACGACLAVTAPAAVAGPSGPAGAVQTVASGPARSLGEPAAASDAAVTAVAATSFGAAGAHVRVWTQRAGPAAWKLAGLILPAGFGSSYDASAAASPSGPLLVVAGTAPPGQGCIANGSVAIADVDSEGRLGAARLVSDQRGTGSFDDRPAVAAGPDGTVWVAWSQGPDSDACQNVGVGDRLKVAVSRDGGRTFSSPVSMPAEGGDSAFGARLAPLADGRVAVSWTERTGDRGEAVLVSVLGQDDRPTRPRVVLTGNAPPLALPGASFYDFPAGDIAALPGGRLLVAAPFWESGRSVLKLAAGAQSGQWRAMVVSPPSGADLLLPALGPMPAGTVRMLCAVHTRTGDRLGYERTDVRVTGTGAAVSAGPAALTPAPSGPGFFEIGEELSIVTVQDGLLASVVVAGKNGAALETIGFRAPRPAARPASPGDRAGSATPGATPASGRLPSATVRARPGSAHVSAAVTRAAAAALACAILLGTFLVLRRRRR